MEIVVGAVCSFLLDLLLGDPPWMPHPVVAIGKYCADLERCLRAHFPKTDRGALAGGVVLATALSLGTLLLTAGVLCGLGWIHPALRFGLEVIWGWQALAMRDLKEESCNVYRCLTTGTLPEARRAVARIVGRDTQNLTEEGVVRAAVETVAENFADGEVAPLFYLLLGGAPLALCYKAINTMDSMVGYRNETYWFFGRGAARLDDGANWLPSRLAALLLIGAAFPGGGDGKCAWRIWWRDRHNHASPNSGQTEAAMAGALGVQLGGPAYYFGAYTPKPTLGDSIRPVEPEDILRANRLLYWGGCLSLIVLTGVRCLAELLWRWLL